MMFVPAFTRLGICVLALLALTASSARAVVFDFESQTASNDLQGAYTVVTSTVGDETLTLTRNGGVAFDVVDLEDIFFGSPSWGHRCIDPFNVLTASSYFIANLSVAADSVSVDWGDFDGDGDELVLTGYSGLDGTGTALATADMGRDWHWDISQGQYETISITANGIRSFTLNSTSDSGDAQSLFYDNFTVTSDFIFRNGFETD